MACIPSDSYVIAYTRVSTKSQSSGPSLETQLTAIMDKASYFNVNIVKKYKDIHTGYGSNNLYKLSSYLLPNFDSDSDDSGDEYHSYFDKNDIRYIMVHSFDRFSRRVVWADQFLTDHPNIAIYSVIDQVSTDSPNGRHIFRNAISNGQLESDLLSEKMKRSVIYRTAKGTYIPSVIPFGYTRKSGADGKIIYAYNTIELSIVKLIKYMTHAPNYPLDVDCLENMLRDVGINVVDDPILEITNDNGDTISEVVFDNTMQVDREPKLLAESDSVELASTKLASTKLASTKLASTKLASTKLASSNLTLDISKPLSKVVIAYFLNAHQIYKRGHEWTGPMVSYIASNSLKIKITPSTS